MEVDKGFRWLELKDFDTIFVFSQDANVWDNSLIIDEYQGMFWKANGSNEMRRTKK